MTTSCSHYFHETIRRAEQCGLNGDNLLSEIGVSREQINDPLWRGRSEQLANLVQLVWFALNDEFMGFTETPCKIGTFAMITHGVLGEESLEKALRKAVFFYGLVTDDIKMSVETDSQKVVFRVEFVRPDLDPNHYFQEFWLSIWYRFISWMGGSLAPLVKATFSYPEPEIRVSEFKYMFPTKFEFDAAQTTLVFERDYLQSPILRSKSELKTLLSLAPLGFMTTPPNVISYGRQIRHFIIHEKKASSKFPSFSAVASALGVGEQSLRRKLMKESTSYRDIVESIRKEMAIKILLNGNKSIPGISEDLGYSEPRAFRRAFHHWTGMSPVQYREHFFARFRLKDRPSQ